MFKLYDYYLSGPCFRVRIALHLKKQSYECIPIHLLKDGGQQFQSIYRAINPQALVPTLELPSQEHLTQSMAIIEFLEETIPEPPLLPSDPVERARIRAFAQMIACDIHPLNNLRVLKHLEQHYSSSPEQITAWRYHWLGLGLESLEKALPKNSKGGFAFGSRLSMADIFLIPQIYSALRFEYPMERHPLLKEIYEHCLTQPAFERALPAKA